ncbi:leucine-rich repeat domain-containing protein [Nostoc sp.]|uniref:leucine-rich repeat domain-containing protein n=1 Tax=Nostoc sp. TaxID=1180 RepID=UPI002FFCBE95
MTNEELLEIIKQAVRDQVTELDLSGKGLTTLPLEIGQLTNLQFLDLNNNKLSSLPPEIVQLTNLQFLDLGSNQLRSLPPEIVQLTNLQSFNLYNNQLSSLAPEFVQLTNLQFLDLSSNQLRSLPPEIVQLTNLQFLNLSSNQLRSLPSEFVQLTNLQSLDLNNNKLSSLPLEFGQLTNLQSLDLYKNQLSSLPPEFGQLTNLQSLYLNNNKLSSLIPEFGQLTNLQSLYLNNNKLSSLPPEFGQLTNLQSLYLNNNKLSSLPPEFGQLTNLQSLDLNNNKLSSLPPEFVQLTNLQSLYLNNNQLSSLPPEFVQLTNLQSLYLSSNPLESPPPEIITKGLRAILDFCRQQLEQKTDLLYEAKLLILGEGGAGKTTLAKKIQNPNYKLQKDETSTEGIDVIQWKFPFKGKEFQVNIWDFGGQEIYHATHQFFITKRSFYTVVADTRKEDTDFYYWLNVVKLLSDDSPLLIVKNEKQERKREINERELRSEFTNFKETLTTNLATDRGLREILNKIQHYISNLPHVGIKLPKTWIKVREALESDLHEYITLEKYLNICQEHGFTKHNDKLQLSGYLHDLGVCLHFQDDDLLRKTVILKPTWGTDAVYKVLDNPQVIENLGQFDRNDLANIWHEDKYADMQPELLSLMMKFKLCYEIPSCPGTYIAPQLLSTNQPDLNWDKSNNLILRYTYTFMPKGILTRFIVETHPWIEQQKLVWKSGVVLNKDQTRAEIIENYNQREIKIRVAGNRTKELMAVITYELEKIHNSYERLQYKTLVPCNCEKCEGSQTPYSYPLNELRDFLDHSAYLIQCRKSFQMVNVRRLIDDVMFQSDRPDKELNPQVAQLQNELERKRDESLTHRLQDSNQKQVFISYTWRDKESKTLVEKIEQAFEAKGIKIIRDSNEIGYKERFKEFMQRLSRGRCVILVISDQYLKSENCMYELVEISKNGNLYQQIFPIILADANIFNPIERIKYIEYWEEKIKELNAALKKVDADNLQGFREDIDQYREIRSTIAKLTDLLRDMNTQTEDIHSVSEFERLVNAIAQRLDE